MKKKKKVLEKEDKKSNSDLKIKQNKTQTIDTKLTEHQKQIKNYILAIKEDATEIEKVEFLFNFVDAGKEVYFEILDPFKLASGLSTKEKFISPDDLINYFSEEGALNEYKIYLQKFESYLMNWSFKTGKDKFLESQLRKLPLATSSSSYDVVQFIMESSEEIEKLKNGK